MFSLKQFESYWCEGSIWIHKLDWLPMLSSLGGASACLSPSLLKESLASWGSMQEVTEEAQPVGPILIRMEQPDLSCLRLLLPVDAQTHHHQLTSGPLHLLLLLQSERLAPPLPFCVCSNATHYSWGLQWSKNPSLPTPFKFYFTFFYSSSITWHVKYHLLICILTISLTSVPCV